MPRRKDLKIDTSKPVMVTGATGYVAGVLIAQLLEKDLTVHATVRDPSKKYSLQYLQDLADKSKGSIKFFAGDLLTPGSFDKAAIGCSIIFHTASPFALTVKDPIKDLIEPSVKGTENVLNTANKTPTVKRVVLTSSTAATYSSAIDIQDAPGKIFTEEVWNRTSTLTDAPYHLSKTMAEQKAWVMAGSQTQWKLVTINPGFVMGPGVKYHESSESYTFMVKLGGGEFSSGVPHISIPVVDVRDVAAAHLAAAYSPDATGRHILCATSTSILDMGKALAKKYPPPKYPVGCKSLPIPKLILWLAAPYVSLSRDYVSKNVGLKMNFDNSKSRNELGIDYYPMETTLQEMYQTLLDLEVVKPKA